MQERYLPEVRSLIGELKWRVRARSSDIIDEELDKLLDERMVKLFLKAAESRPPMDTTSRPRFILPGERTPLQHTGAQDREFRLQRDLVPPASTLSFENQAGAIADESRTPVLRQTLCP